jgi:hypothetical protein
VVSTTSSATKRVGIQGDELEEFLKNQKLDMD